MCKHILACRIIFNEFDIESILAKIPARKLGGRPRNSASCLNIQSEDSERNKAETRKDLTKPYLKKLFMNHPAEAFNRPVLSAFVESGDNRLKKKYIGKVLNYYTRNNMRYYDVEFEDEFTVKMTSKNLVTSVYHAIQASF